MTGNLLPGIELANGDCAAVLPELPPADLIPPRRPMTVCGNMADTTTPLTLTRLPRLVSPPCAGWRAGLDGCRPNH